MAWQFATLEMRSQETGPSELFVKTSGTNGSVTRGAGEKLVNSCLVPRPHYCARPIRFGSSGPSEFTSSDTSPNCIDREGLGRRCTGRQGL